MGYAVQLYFDPPLEAASNVLRQSLAAAGVTPTLDRLGDRPHISLSVLNSLDGARFLPLLERFAGSCEPFSVEFAAFASFPTDQGVVYLSPAPSEVLRRCQKQLHELLVGIEAEVHEYYVPRAWVPHSTVGFGLPAPEVSLALAWLRDHFKPMAGRFTHIGVIEFPPVKEMARYPLGV